MFYLFNILDSDHIITEQKMHFHWVNTGKATGFYLHCLQQIINQLFSYRRAAHNYAIYHWNVPSVGCYSDVCATATWLCDSCTLPFNIWKWTTMEKIELKGFNALNVYCLIEIFLHMRPTTLKLCVVINGVTCWDLSSRNTSVTFDWISSCENPCIALL